MSEDRLPTQEELDIDRTIDLLDEAFMSDDPAIQKCLQRLLVTVALTRDHRSKTPRGPLRHLLEQVHDLRSRVHVLERGDHAEQMKRLQQTPLPYYAPQIPTWTAPNTMTWGVGTAVDPSMQLGNVTTTLKP